MNEYGLTDLMSRNKAERESKMIEGSDWMNAAIILIRDQVQPQWEGTGEQLRAHLLSLGLAAPEHYRQWGSMMRHALRLRLLIKTGKMGNSSTHGRRATILRRR